MLKKSFIIKRLSSVFIAASMLSALTACAYFGEHESTPGADAAENAKPDAERETGKRLLTAFSAGDYKSFAKGLPPDVASKFNAAEFDRTRNELLTTVGKVEGFEFLTELRTPVIRTFVWKVVLERKSEKGEPIRQDLLFRVLVGKLEGKPYVISFGFI